MRLPEAVLEDARVGIAARLGLDFRTSQSSRLERGLSAMLRTEGVPAAQAATYLQELWTLPTASPEWARLSRHFTIGETYFFRDQASFDAIRETVLPDLLAIAHRESSQRRLRIWCAGCATGEEPFSLAMLLDQLRIGPPEVLVEILATDVNIAALDAARSGVYREWALRATPAAIRAQYFKAAGQGHYELSAAIRSRVTFQMHNLADETGPLGLGDQPDLVLCRNVLMYFVPETAKRIILRLQEQLKDGGWLVTAPSEASADSYSQLTAVNFPGAILFRKGKPATASSQARRPLPAPVAQRRTEEASALPPVRVKAPLPAPPPVVSPPPATVPQAATRLLAQAQKLANEGRLADAQAACEQVLDEDVLLAEAHILLGAIRQEQGDVEGAKDAFRRALYLDPDATAAHFLLGILLARQGEWAATRRSMQAAATLLERSPLDQALSWADDLTAGRLLETARSYLEAEGGVRR